MDKIVNKIIFYGFFILFPLLAQFIPEFDFKIFKVNPELLWLFLVNIVVFFYFLFSKRKIIYTNTVKAIILFYLYVFINTYAHGYKLMNTYIFLVFMSINFLIFLDNLKFTYQDLKRFYKVLFYLSIIIFIVSFIQLFIDPSFYRKEIYEESNLRAWGNVYRSLSIFTNMQLDQGLLGIIFLFSIFLFTKNISKIKKQIVVPLLVMAGFFSLYRYVMASILIVFVYYFFIEYRKKIILLIIPIILISSLLLPVVLPSIENTDFYQKRIMKDVKGRYDDPLTFFEYYLSQHPIVFGKGISSYYDEFAYLVVRRLHAGVWDIFYQGGIVGLSLFLLWLFQLYRRAKYDSITIKNNVFFIFPIVLLFINFTARLNNIYYWGLFLFYYYMNMKEKLESQGTRNVSKK